MFSGFVVVACVHFYYCIIMKKINLLAFLFIGV